MPSNIQEPIFKQQVCESFEKKILVSCQGFERKRERKEGRNKGRKEGGRKRKKEREEGRKEGKKEVSQSIHVKINFIFKLDFYLCLLFCFIHQFAIVFLDSTYKWYHIVFIFLCLTYFIQHNDLHVHPCCCKQQNFFFMAEQYSIVFMYHIIFIYSSVNGHLGCFHAKVILKKKNRAGGSGSLTSDYTTKLQSSKQYGF